MPWQHVFVPNPSDDKLPVLKKVPKDYEVTGADWSFQRARLPFDKLLEKYKANKNFKERRFYSCRYCKGWIEGEPYEYHEDDIGPLCGRRGDVFSCIRCGNEIGFCGMVS